MLLTLKILVSSVLIATASWLAGKKPWLAGFLIALPLSSFLSILFTYAEYRDMEKVNQYTLSILVAVPLSLVFFVPFVLNRWLKMGFPLTITLALVLLAGSYLLHSHLVK